MSEYPHACYTRRTFPATPSTLIITLNNTVQSTHYHTRHDLISSTLLPPFQSTNILYKTKLSAKHGSYLKTILCVQSPLHSPPLQIPFVLSYCDKGLLFHTALQLVHAKCQWRVNRTDSCGARDRTNVHIDCYVYVCMHWVYRRIVIELKNDM